MARLVNHYRASIVLAMQRGVTRRLRRALFG